MRSTYLLLGKTSSQILAKRAESALSAFRKAVTELKAVNTEIVTERSKVTEKMAKLNAEAQALSTAFDDNLHTISKIEEFLPAAK